MQPPKELSVVYYNARSLLPKFDELCVLVSQTLSVLQRLGFVLMYWTMKSAFLDTIHIVKIEIVMEVEYLCIQGVNWQSVLSQTCLLALSFFLYL